jgi:hypothetical protein
VNYPPDRHNDNRWNLCLDRLIEAWNKHGPDITLATLTWLCGDSAARDCHLPCDTDCEISPVHCWNWHRPNHKPDWHDPAACDAGKSAATGETA